MADSKPKHQHSKNDIIIKDQDGSFKILQNGHFVPLDEADAKEHGLDKKEENNVSSQPAKSMPLSHTSVKTEVSSHDIKGFGDEGLQQQAQDIVKKSGVTFASGEAQQRVYKVLVSHLKGVRKPYETKQSLMKESSNGGAGLREEEVGKILTAAGVQLPSAPKAMPVVTELPKDSMPSVKQKISTLPVGKDLSAPANFPNEIKAKEVPLKPTLPPVQLQKPQIMDVQKPQMPTVGLAGELSYSLADWRRVGVNPQDRVKKIENQLGVLEEDNFPMRLRGLSAWRNSEVMKLYLEAGKQSLEKGQALEELLGQGSGEQLTWEEWQAIADLNQRIRT